MKRFIVTYEEVVEKTIEIEGEDRYEVEDLFYDLNRDGELEERLQSAEVVAVDLVHVEELG